MIVCTIHIVQHRDVARDTHPIAFPPCDLSNAAPKDERQLAVKQRHTKKGKGEGKKLTNTAAKGKRKKVAEPEESDEVSNELHKKPTYE